ncbi:MAG: glycosyltransferase family 4 protein [Candidatus Aenigmarchaeota archaeon]|nr:glycosyltransferase family 4 protein [Candidatus Aenigmarchaeota archaeon]
MKALQISTPFLPVKKDLAYGGTERIVYLLDRGLTERGIDSYVAGPATSATSGTLLPTLSHEMGITGVLDKGEGLAFGDSYSLLWHVHKSLGYASNEAVDVVHVHDDYLLPFMGLIKRPSLLTLHSDCEGGFWDPRTFPSVAQLGARMVAISESQRRTYERAGYHVGHVVYNGIDPDSFEFSGTKADYLLILGGIAPHKGQHVALDIGERAGLDVIIAGNVGNKDYFDERVRPHLTHDISPEVDKFHAYRSLVPSQNARIVYAGPVNDAQKRPLYAHAKAFLMPIAWEEPFGLVMVEAMASGTPVIAYNRGSVPEVIDDGRTGYIVETAGEMGKAVQYIHRIRPSACRERVVRHFSAAAMTDAYLDLYRQLASS